MKKIKILHVIKTLNMGGAESNLLNLARSFDPQRFEIQVAYSAGGELEPLFQKQGVKLFKFADRACKIKSFATLPIVTRLARHLREEKITIVHTHTFNAHLWGSAAAKLSGCKILEHVHDSRYMDPREFYRRGEISRQYKMIKWFKNVADRVVVLTRKHYDFVVQNRIYPAERVQEIQNGIALDEAPVLSADEKQNLRRRFGILSHQQVVLTPLRFSPEKNLAVLFEIVKGVTQMNPQAVCVIAGDGPERPGFQAMIDKENKQRQIKLIGFHPHIPELLNITDVFLLPSTIELHSIAIMEAMRQKVPVVVSSGVGCNDEFIENGRNGLLLDPFTANGWAEAIIDLLHNPGIRSQLAEAGFQTVVDKFDIKNIIKKFESLYVELTYA